MADMMNDDGGEEIDLSLYLGDDPVPYVPVAVPGNVDVTAKLGTAVVRVATVDDRVVLTISGADGMATAKFSRHDSVLLGNLLARAEDDLRTRL
jgi:hypothetical protein